MIQKSDLHYNHHHGPHQSRSISCSLQWWQAWQRRIRKIRENHVFNRSFERWQLVVTALNSVLRMVSVFWAMVMETKTAGVRWQESWEGRSAHRRQLDEDQRPGSPCQVSYDSSQGSHHPSYSGRKSKRVLQVLDPCSFPLQFSILKMEKWNWIAGTRLLQLSTSSHSSTSSFCWPEDQGSQMDITTDTEL